MLARKTVNGNYLIRDVRNYEYRFIKENGSHLRWVDSSEADYLCKAIELGEFPELYPDNALLPSVTTIWQHVTPPENPELSNNGGSYAYLNRVEKLEGWGGELDGIRLITNHLYASDYEDQGWNTEKYFESESEAWNWIENFNSVLV